MTGIAVDGVEPSLDRNDSTSFVDRAHSIFGKIITFGSLAGLLLYLALWVASVQFYGSIGASPEDVGFGYPGTAVPIMLTMIVAFLITEGSGILYLLWVIINIVLTIRLYRRPLGCPAIIVVGFFAATIFEAALHISSPPVPIALYLVAVLLAAPIAYGLLAWIASIVLHDPAASRSQVWFRMRREGRRVAGFVIAGAVLLPALATIAILDTQSSTYATVVKQGSPLIWWSSPWRASPATARWLDQNTISPVNDQCVMYLGEANGFVLLYDVRAQRSVRVQVAVSLW